MSTQNNIINAIKVFDFDSYSMQQQFFVESMRLQNTLKAKYAPAIAAAQYEKICNNVKQYFLQVYNIQL